MSTEVNNGPIHLGLILDGNRRWAKKQGIPQLEGHRKGYENLKDIGIAAIENGVKYVSAYVFSTENWNRSKEEVSYLMKLLLWVAKNEVDILHKENIRVLFAGSKEKLSKEIIAAIEKAEEKTVNNTRGTLILCLNYGGHQEISDAVKGILADDIKPDKITSELVSKYLYTPDIPSLDMIIRTSGEQRISGFMLWRAAYAELYFTNKFWPEFSKDDLIEAIGWYKNRERRFGS